MGEGGGRVVVLGGDRVVDAAPPPPHSVDLCPSNTVQLDFSAPPNTQRPLPPEVSASIDSVLLRPLAPLVNWVSLSCCCVRGRKASHPGQGAASSNTMT